MCNDVPGLPLGGVGGVGAGATRGPSEPQGFDFRAADVERAGEECLLLLNRAAFGAGACRTPPQPLGFARRIASCRETDTQTSDGNKNDKFTSLFITAAPTASLLCIRKLSGEKHKLKRQLQREPMVGKEPWASLRWSREEGPCFGTVLR